MSSVGVSTACYYPEDTFAAFRNVCALNVPVAEIFMNSVSELTRESLSRFVELSRSSGTKIISFHPYTSAFESLLFFSEYTRRLDDGIEVYKRFFDGAAYVGAKYFVFHGERSAPTFSRSLSSDAVLTEAYGRLIETAKSFGLVFTQENVNNHRSHSPEFIRHLRKLVPELAFTFDLKQALRAHQSYEDTIAAMGDRLVHVHINDFGEHECALPFCGNVDLPQVKKLLDGVSFSGDYVLEVYRTCFADDNVLKESLDKTAGLFCANA